MQALRTASRVNKKKSHKKKGHKKIETQTDQYYQSIIQSLAPLSQNSSQAAFKP